MGCASSNPLVEGGKNLMNNAKQATDNVIGMGEKAMHDAGDAVNTGIDHVKHSVESGISAAQNSIGTVVHNVENTLGLAKNNAEEAATTLDEHVEAVEAVEETISDAKTVLAFEDATNATEDALKDEFGETVEMVESQPEETLHVEDVDEGSTTTTTTAAAVEAEAGAKEASPMPPTPWEVAADAIHGRRARIAAVAALEDDADFGDGVSGGAFATSSKDGRGGNATSDILLSDTISIKSYKSEI